MNKHQYAEVARIIKTKCIHHNPLQMLFWEGKRGSEEQGGVN